MDRKSIKTGIFGAVCGAIALAIYGFSWGGWVTESKASFLIANAGENAVMNRLAPICLVQFQHDPEKEQKTLKFREAKSWTRGEFVGKQGWATMIGEKEPDGAVARRCAELIAAAIG